MTSGPPHILTSPFSHESIDPKPLTVVLLNWTLPDHTLPLWESASLRICADGGANRLYDEVTRRQSGAPDGPQHLPTAIVGDLDSIRPEVADFYRDAGVEIVDLSHDQDLTDLQKCMEFARQRGGVAGHIVAFGAHGGRLDHILSNLGTLYRYRDLPLVLVGEGNATRLIRKGRTVVRVERDREGPCCGLVPLAGPARASTQGLRWDMDNTEMKMGGLLSTSNLVQGDSVEIFTDADLIWTIQCS